MKASVLFRVSAEWLKYTVAALGAPNLFVPEMMEIDGDFYFRLTFFQTKHQHI